MKTYCSSGVNFYIIESDGRYSRCYSSGFGRQIHMGNIAHESKLHQYDRDGMICPYNVECNHGCRNGCDWGQTIRFDENGNGYPGPVYLFDKGVTIDSLERDKADIYWHLSRLCNFNCVYCVEPHDPEVDKVMPWELSTEQSVMVMKKLVSQFNHLHLQITGGEPSRHPAFLDIVQEAFYNQDKVTLRILSNMSMYERMKDVLSLPWQKGKLFIWASCHFSEKRFNLDKFIDLCLMAQKVGSIEVSTVDHEHERGFYKIYFEAIKASGVNCPFHHQYYDPNRSKTLKFKDDFVPSTLRRALEILGRESEYDDVVKKGHLKFVPAPSLHGGVSEQPQANEGFIVTNLPNDPITFDNQQIANMRRTMVRPYIHTPDDFFAHICSLVGEGDIVEVGRGKSTSILASHFPSRVIHVFDSETGLTDKWIMSDNLCHDPGWNKPMEPVPDGVRYVKGLIQETIHGWSIEGKIALLSCDVETYEPSLAVLNGMNKYLVPGSLIALHFLSDWGQPGYYDKWPNHQWRAFIEWMRDHDRSCQMVSRNNLYSGVFRILK